MHWVFMRHLAHQGRPARITREWLELRRHRTDVLRVPRKRIPVISQRAATHLSVRQCCWQRLSSSKKPASEEARRRSILVRLSPQNTAAMDRAAMLRFRRPFGAAFALLEQWHQTHAELCCSRAGITPSPADNDGGCLTNCGRRCRCARPAAGDIVFGARVASIFCCRSTCPTQAARRIFAASASVNDGPFLNDCLTHDASHPHALVPRRSAAERRHGGWPKQADGMPMSPMRYQYLPCCAICSAASSKRGRDAAHGKQVGKNGSHRNVCSPSKRAISERRKSTSVNHAGRSTHLSRLHLTRARRSAMQHHRYGLSSGVAAEASTYGNRSTRKNGMAGSSSNHWRKRRSSAPWKRCSAASTSKPRKKCARPASSAIAIAAWGRCCCWHCLKRGKRRFTPARRRRCRRSRQAKIRQRGRRNLQTFDKGRRTLVKSVGKKPSTKGAQTI